MLFRPIAEIGKKTSGKLSIIESEGSDQRRGGMGTDRSVSRGLFHRMVSVIAGPLLALGVPYGIWVTELDAVARAAALDEMAAKVVELPCGVRDSSADVRLVHVTGRATSTETLEDPLLGVSAVALRLQRKAEMYQWIESSRSSNGSTIFNYQATWCDRPIDSSKFYEHEHSNPPMPVESKSWSAAHAKLGELELNTALVGMIEAATPLPLADTTKLKPEAQKFTLRDGQLVLGKGDRIGDMRIAFASAQPQEISVVSGCRNNALEPWRSGDGKTRQLLMSGVVDARTMVEHQRHEDVLQLWKVRGLLFLGLLIGIAMTVEEMAALARAIPGVGIVLGPLVHTGGWVITLPLACSIMLMVSGAAWIAARPLLAAGLIGAGLLLVIRAHVVHARDKRAARA